jgi:hypothetical protein
VLAAIGQPMAKADDPSHHKIISPADIEERQRPAHDKTIMAVITAGKANLALPSMHLSETLH